MDDSRETLSKQDGDIERKNSLSLSFKMAISNNADGSVKWIAYGNIIGGMLVHTVLGIVAIWGNISIYVTSYLRVENDSLTMNQTYLTFPLTILTGAIFMQLGAYLFDKIHCRLQMALGSLLICVPIFCVSFTQNYPLFLFLYSVCNGAGYGLIYMLPVKNAWNFFPEKKGRVGGMILMFYSIGAIAWNFITKALANPNGDEPDVQIGTEANPELVYSPNSDVIKNVPWMFQVMGVIFFVLLFFATLLIKKKVNSPIDDLRDSLALSSRQSLNETPSLTFHAKEETPLTKAHKAKNFTPSSNMTEGIKTSPNNTVDSNLEMQFAKLEYRPIRRTGKVRKYPYQKLTIKQCLMQKTFWLIFVMLMLSMSFSYFMKPQIKNYGVTKFKDDTFLTICGSLAFAISSISKFGWGTAQDYIGFVKVYIIILILQTFVCFSIDFVSHIKACYMIWIMLVFVGEGAHFVIFPALSSALYGPELGAQVYSYLFFGMALAACIGIVASNFVLATLGWFSVFCFFGILTILSGGILFFYREKPVETKAVPEPTPFSSPGAATPEMILNIRQVEPNH